MTDLIPSPVRLLVVIVNYRTPDLTIEALRSLVPEIQAMPDTHVVVTDNRSGDNSVAHIAEAIATEAWGAWVTLMPLERNGGFAYGNNAAICPALQSAAPPAYILLLNPDTVVRPAGLQQLVAFMDQHPQVGIAGSRLEDPDGTPQRSAFRFHSLGSEVDAALQLGVVSKLLARWVAAPPVVDEAIATDWVAGASMIVRRQVFEATGLLDEAYFMYYEEMDFCLQARRAGWSCWYVPQSHIVHLVGQSSGVTHPTCSTKRRPQYWFDSRRRYFLKNHGWLSAAVTDAAWATAYVLWQVRRSLQHKPNVDPPQLWSDFLKNSVFVKGIRQPPTAPTLWQQIKEDWVAHGCDWTKPGFRAVAVQRFGVWRMTLKPKLLRAPFSLLYRALFRHVRNVYGIELPYTVQLGRRVVIEHQSGIVIHGHCAIGDDSVIRQGVTLGNRYCDRPLEAPKLGARVSVGAGAAILGKISVGDDATIGANAVVLRDIPPRATAVGIPAKISQLTKIYEDFSHRNS